MSDEIKVERVTHKRKRRWVVHVYIPTNYQLFGALVSSVHFLDREGQFADGPVYFVKRAQVERALALFALRGGVEEP